MKKTFTYKEIAELLGVSERTIRREVERGSLGSIKVGNRPRITLSHFEEYLSRDGQDGKALAKSLLSNNGNGK